MAHAVFKESLRVVYADTMEVENDWKATESDASRAVTAATAQAVSVMVDIAACAGDRTAILRREIATVERTKRNIIRKQEKTSDGVPQPFYILWSLILLEDRILL
jgi:hypothetical protein